MIPRKSYQVDDVRNILSPLNVNEVVAFTISSALQNDVSPTYQSLCCGLFEKIPVTPCIT